ncbi:MAG: peptidoglycan-binding protein, partial [Clostridiales bacterium]|nr:peptidoglycan-binding protein [Clostridiales bacterium]
MKNGVIKRLALVIALLAMVTVFAVPLASAASYSKVYGQTQSRVRVRESASTNATIIDNVVKDACVYITSSKTSGSNTFVQIKYRDSDGNVASGWVCQSDGKTTYVKVLSAQQAKDKFKVSGGDLPSTRVGTFTAKQRSASASDSDNSYIKSGSSGEAVKSLQTKLKALGLYSGEITGNVGSKTEAAIKAFQAKYGLTADGIAGPQTLAKIDAAYAASGSSSSSSSSSSTSGLKLGSQGTAVRNLQQDLTTLGYYWAEITGNFGSKTETAVKRFQEENGLTADGVAGTKTLNAIAAAVAKKGGSSASSSTSSGTALKLNSQGTKVSRLQQDLKQLGYYYAEITGNFGEKTEAAVKKFQQAKGLTADGVAGTNTLNAIASAIAAAGGSTSSGTGTSGMKLGSTGDDVRALQQNLTTLGYYYGDITGRYGSLTQQAVKKFQKARGLTADGVAGTSTVNAIASTLKSSGSTPAGGSGSTTAGTLREGDSGTAVTELQTMLKKLGYYYGDITGSFGSLTRKAVRKFQDANNLTVDGIAGAATLSKLRALTGGTISDGGSSGTTVTTENSYGRIIKDNVYLRASYSTTSASKASLGKGQLLRITKTYTSAGVKWYYVSVNMGSYTHNGYVRSDMMEIISESEYNSNGGNSGNNYSDQEILGMIKVTGNN